MLAIGLKLTGAVLAQTARPPLGYLFLRGRNADGSYSILRGARAGTYVNLAGKAS